MRTLQLIILLCFSTHLFAQKITISGYLTDGFNGEALIYGNVFLKNTTIGTSSNEYGYYSIDIPADQDVVLIYSYLGYQNVEKSLSASTDEQINVSLTSGTDLVEVEVKANKITIEQEEVRSTQMSTVNIPVEQIKTIPTVGGELDIIKVVQLMPGVTKGGEGTSGMFVRGGDADQNLVLLDEATVYNISHLFGFFSVFNPDAIKDLNLIKGAFPAQYGGRLSSVLDIRMKEGNKKKFEVSGGLGILSSRITLEGPLKKDKASFLISGRRTYIDKVFKAFGSFMPYYFYDFNAKLNYTLSEKDRIFVSAYFGDDVLSLDESDVDGEDIEVEDEEGELGNFGFGFQLGNFTQTVRWNHIYNPKLFSNLSLIHTAFNYDINGEVANNSVIIKSAIEDIGLKLDFTNYQSDTKLYKFGLHVINHQFRPNILSFDGDVAAFLENRPGDKRNTLESAAYGNAEYTFQEDLKLNLGFRLSSAIVRDQVYWGFEPRFGSAYILNNNQSFKASYSRMYQYMHLVSSSTVALPTDLWYPVSENVKPQSSDQIAVGYEQYLPKEKLKISVEAYHKWMRNLIEYKEGSNLIFNDNFENLLLQGKGRAWGAELLVRKSTGRLNGWVAYSLNWSKRFFDELNEGEPFFSKYDRRHVLSVVGNYDINKRLTFSAVWEYLSGSRFTPLLAQYIFPDASLTNVEFIPIYSRRNEIQLSPSHRLDVNFIFKNKRTKKFQSEIHLGCYNTYHRTQPYRVSVTLDPDTGDLKYQQRGLFGVIPSLAWNFKF